MTIARVCHREVRLADEEDSVLAAAASMRDQNVGTLLVNDAQGRPCGIITDRDLVVRVLGEGRDPTRTRVTDVMTRHPNTVKVDTTIEEALATMRLLGVRRMPVVGAKGELVGVVSVDDVLALLAAELDCLSKVLAHGATSRRLPAVPSLRVRDLAGLERAATDPEC